MLCSLQSRKQTEKREGHESDWQYVSGRHDGNIGWDPYPIYSDQPAGDPGAEDLWKNQIREIPVSVEKKYGKAA